jgi:3-hydroxybutyryl-CoA dehydrogenase
MDFGKIMAFGSSAQRTECIGRKLPGCMEWHFSERLPSGAIGPETSCIFILDEQMAASFPFSLLDADTLVFIHDVNRTLEAYPAHLPLVRMNAWPGFFGGPLLELSARDDVRPKADAFLDALGWDRSWVPDIPGMIRPRVLSMIINEACFALAESVSTRDEIDTAMKLGTNYPFGPFEWAARIGPARIHGLLSTLAAQDGRYQPAPGMAQLLHTQP